MSRNESSTPIYLRFALVSNGTKTPYKFYLEPDGVVIHDGKRMNFTKLEEWARKYRLGIPQIVNEVR